MDTKKRKAAQADKAVPIKKPKKSKHFQHPEFKEIDVPLHPRIGPYQSDPTEVYELCNGVLEPGTAYEWFRDGDNKEFAWPTSIKVRDVPDNIERVKEMNDALAKNGTGKCFMEQQCGRPMLVIKLGPPQQEDLQLLAEKQARAQLRKTLMTIAETTMDWTDIETRLRNVNELGAVVDSFNEYIHKSKRAIFREWVIMDMFPVNST
jgi:hypothetical protein